MRPLLLTLLFLSSTALMAKDPASLPPNARVAIIGDSITEQKLYSKYMEVYLLACAGRKDIKVFQFGWGGEQASGMAARYANDLGVFNPTVVTTCYGMNDGGYQPYNPTIGQRYEQNMRISVEGMKKMGVQTIVLGSPGAVDTKYFARTPAAVYNDNLAHLRDLDKKLAAEFKQPFANVHDTMVDAMAKAKAALGEDYDVCGRDGVHPGANGHLLMAQAFLKGLGLDGDIGIITVDMAGEATATGGHKVVSGKAGVCELESTSWPFCFDADPKSSGSTRSILPFSSFNQDLNRFTLVVKGLTKDKAKVTWGATAKEFSKAQLEKGINLASEFAAQTPFDASFAKLLDAVAYKQAFETLMIKNMITNFRSFANEAKADPEFAKAEDALKAKLVAKQADLDAKVHEHLKPVKHKLIVE